jgi:hypothetical protein
VALDPSNPQGPPLIDPNHIAEPFDHALARLALRTLLKLTQTKALSQHISKVTLTSTGEEVNPDNFTDEEADKHIDAELFQVRWRAPSFHSLTPPSL